MIQQDLVAMISKIFFVSLNILKKVTLIQALENQEDFKLKRIQNQDLEVMKQERSNNESKLFKKNFQKILLL